MNCFKNAPRLECLCYIFMSVYTMLLLILFLFSFLSISGGIHMYFWLTTSSLRSEVTTLLFRERRCWVKKAFQIDRTVRKLWAVYLSTCCITLKLGILGNPSMGLSEQLPINLRPPTIITVINWYWYYDFHLRYLYADIFGRSPKIQYNLHWQTYK